jgi:hypothetical protein
VDGRDADACAEFRPGTFRTELKGLVDGIENVERRATAYELLRRKALKLAYH